MLHTFTNKFVTKFKPKLTHKFINTFTYNTTLLECILGKCILLPLALLDTYGSPSWKAMKKASRKKVRRKDLLLKLGSEEGLEKALWEAVLWSDGEGRGATWNAAARVGATWSG